ncbi:MAG TPA: SDR family oxidoreductase [Gemmatimonadaceae bacterium]|nr:SDR family oxidoreductase [Gemmatimonadaceae bacterium]
MSRRSMRAQRASTARSNKPLDGRVAVVAGATRGAGRGIARALGEAGAFVYCTGRSVRGDPSPYGRPETINETAEMIAETGGAAVAVRVDHTDESQVAALFARVQEENKRLDILVNSVAGEDPRMGGWEKFWKTDLSYLTEGLRHSVVSHLITAKHAAPLMMKKRRGLIVEVTEGDFLISGSGNIMRDLSKSGQKSLAMSFAEALRSHGIASVAITPGFLRSEMMLQHFGVTEATWRDAGKKDPHFLQSESPLFVGRAVAALAQDPHVLARSGDVYSSWELAREYGFADADGSRPDWGAHMTSVLVPEMAWFREGLERYLAQLVRHVSRVKRYLGDTDSEDRHTMETAEIAAAT